MNNEKLEQAIQHLREHFSNLDNVLYDHYTRESLEAELCSVMDSIQYLESLVQ